jgi:hypothetical protein
VAELVYSSDELRRELLATAIRGDPTLLDQYSIADAVSASIIATDGNPITFIDSSLTHLGSSA